VGATVAAPAAGESIAELAAWIRQRGKVADVSRTVHAYPTMSEGPARAADDYLRRRLARPPVQTAARAVLAARGFGAALTHPRSDLDRSHWSGAYMRSIGAYGGPIRAGPCRSPWRWDFAQGDQSARRDRLRRHHCVGVGEVRMNFLVRSWCRTPAS